jgi:hypothetical protein
VMVAATRIPIPSPATQCMVDPTTWRLHGYKLFMGAWHRLPTAEGVEQSAERTAVQCDDDKTDLHDQRFGSSSNIDGDKESEYHGQDEPQPDRAIDWPRCSNRWEVGIYQVKRSESWARRANRSWALSPLNDDVRFGK